VISRLPRVTFVPRVTSLSHTNHQSHQFQKGLPINLSNCWHVALLGSTVHQHAQDVKSEASLSRLDSKHTMPFDQDSGQVFDEYIVKPQAPRPRSLSRVYYQYSPETPEKSTDDSWVFNPTHWHPRSRVRHKPRHLKLDGENDAQDVYQYADKRYCWDGMGRMSHPRNCDQDDHGAESEVGSYNLGPRCLFEMALQAVANGIDTVDCSFENMPYTVVLPIFNFMSARYDK